MADERNCSCFEIAGEDPNCILHGGGTLWRKENPDFCEIFDKLATLRADLAKAVEGNRLLREIVGAHINADAYASTPPEDEDDAKQLRKSEAWHRLQAQSWITDELNSACNEAVKERYQQSPEFQSLIKELRP